MLLSPFHAIFSLFLLSYNVQHRNLIQKCVILQGSYFFSVYMMLCSLYASYRSIYINYIQIYLYCIYYVHILYSQSIIKQVVFLPDALLFGVSCSTQSWLIFHAYGCAATFQLFPICLPPSLVPWSLSPVPYIYSPVTFNTS